MTQGEFRFAPTRMNPGTYSEGRACRVLCTTLDSPFRFHGHDKRAPPTLEGPARRVRSAMFDKPSRLIGHDKRAPPSGHDKHVPPLQSR
jgi:hypothetical protein